MPSGSVRTVLRSPSARFVPSRLSAIPALMAGPLRPDVLITRLVERGGELRFGTEVSYQRALVDSGIPVLAVIDDTAPSASAEPALDRAQVHVIGHTSDGPAHVHREPEPLHDALADAVCDGSPAGARVQYGPGQLGTALLRRATVPLRIDTGMLTDAVVDLESHGMLIGQALGNLFGGHRGALRLVRGSPNPARHRAHPRPDTGLSRGEPFIAVNTVIEIDPYARSTSKASATRCRRHRRTSDYCAAGRMSSGGLSIIAVRRRPTAGHRW